MQKNKREKALAFHKENHSKKIRCKKRETCRGGKDHDWLLTIPDYIKTVKEMTPEMITEYYKIREKEEKFKKEIDNDFIKIGIKKYTYNNQITKYYICSVCGKKEYDVKIK